MGLRRWFFLGAVKCIGFDKPSDGNIWRSPWDYVYAQTIWLLAIIDSVCIKFQKWIYVVCINWVVFISFIR